MVRKSIKIGSSGDIITMTNETIQEQADLNLYALLCGRPKAEKIRKELNELLNKQ